MALVEAVGGELRDLVEDGAGEALREPARHRAGDENVALLVHLRLDLLAHRAPQQVGGAERVAREIAGDLHHLLLVDDDAVGLLEDRLQHRVRVFRVLAAVLDGDVARDVVHRARAVERHHGDDVLEAVRLELLQRLLHPAGFELEHAIGLGAAHQAVGLGVVERQLVEDQRHAERIVHQGLGGPQEGQGGQAEEVELDQPDLLDRLHVELRHRHRRARVAVERHQLLERPVADDDARGVGRGVPRQAFELACGVDQDRDLLVGAPLLVEPRLHLEGLLDGRRARRVVRDELGDAVDLAVGQPHHPADVADHGAGLQPAEGNDVGDAVVPVLLTYILDDLVAPVLAEVDVEVGHRDALGVQEALEEEPEAQRVEIGDLQRPGGDRAGPGAAARAHRDPLPLGPADEVRDDQEIARELHLDDDFELELEPIAVALERRLAVGSGSDVRDDVALEPPLEAAPRLLPERQGLDLEPVARTRGSGSVGRQDRLAAGDLEGAAPGDDEGVGDRLGQILEQPGHLVRRLEAQLGAGPRPVLLDQAAAIGDAAQDVLRLVVLGLQKADVVGRDQRQIEGVGLRHEPVLGPGLHVVAGADELDIAATGEGVLQGPERRRGRVGPAVEDEPAERALGAARQQDEPVVVGAKPLGGDPDVTDAAFQVGRRQQLQERAVADLVLAEDGHEADDGLVLGGARDLDRHEAADDRLDAGAGEGVADVVAAEQRRLVGHRHGRHPGRPAGGDEAVGAHRALQERPGGAHAQMDEAGLAHGSRSPSSSGRSSPSAKAYTRSSRLASRRSWVAMTALAPFSARTFKKAAKTTSAVASSRLPVGSSASTSAGALASARAMATRCCSPPESWLG